ncbi:MAG: hypothetical protein ILP10_06785 [Lachnospiraceae bacterium]|nr:hypothetical protein [Lachnospiraceae bacterium]
MKEMLYEIPINDAFDKNCGCPMCYLHNSLTRDTVEFTMGPSYMEDDVRMQTNRLGFCREHVSMLYGHGNRLGLALMLKTHMDEVIDKVEAAQKEGRAASGGFLKKKTAENPVSAYLLTQKESCFMCERINRIFDRYLATVFYMYTHDPGFKGKLEKSKGLCMEHYRLLYELAPQHLKGKDLENFTHDIDEVFLSNLKETRDDVDWYTRKFDYRFKDEPWKNAKDSIQRAMEKTASLYYDGNEDP